MHCLMVLLKPQNKKYKQGRFFRALLASLSAPLVQRLIYSIVKDIREKLVRKAGRGYME